MYRTMTSQEQDMFPADCMAFIPTRRYVMSMFVLVCCFQGVVNNPMAALPGVAKDLFPKLTDGGLAWEINANNIAQALSVPIAAATLMKSRGVRDTVVYATALQLCQWYVAT